MVSKDFCFRTRYKSVVKAKEALAKYTEGIAGKDAWLEEGSNFPFFLDTCVLLNLYDISAIERNAFIQFLQKNKQRMIIPSQVEREYIRHRIPRIKGFKSRVANIKAEMLGFAERLPKTFESLKGGINGVLNRNIVKFGMSNVYAKFLDLLTHLNEDQTINDQQKFFSEFCEETTIQIKEECDRCCNEADFEYNDPILAAISDTIILSSLSAEEQSFIVGLYKSLKTAYDAKEEKGRGDITFPGAGDGEKPIDGPIEESVAWGDLYIYHEVLNYMKEHDTDAVLLTRDVTKGDWLKFDKTPYVHYLVNAYELTGHLLYILDVDDFIPMTFESIAEDIDDDDEIPEKTILQDNILVDTDSEEDDDNPFEKNTLKPGGLESCE